MDRYPNMHSNTGPLLELHTALRQKSVVARFVLLVRWLLALAFLPSGLKKVAGERFTQIGSDHPVGSFFEAFFQAHEFYLFVGLAQVLAALLLLWPRTALLGTLLFLPIITNIFVITWSMHFQGTVFITGALLLATLFLLLWDVHRLVPLFSPRLASLPAVAPSQRLSAKAAATWTLGFGILGLVVGATLAQGPGQLAGPLLLICGAALLPACLACAWETAAVWRKG